MIRVVLADNFSIMREGIKSVVQKVDDMTIVGVADNGKEVISLTAEVEPDVILMNIYMPELDGIKVGRKIKQTNPNIKLIYLTTFIDGDFVIKGINAGADGFLYKEINEDMLIQTIRNVYANQIVISGEAARILAERIRNMPPNRQDMLEEKLRNSNLSFTEREIQVAKLLMKDKTNKHIAKHLHLSEGTVKNYISEIYTKLNIHRRSKVIAYLNSLYDAR